jgi:hypothetical protein
MKKKSSTAYLNDLKMESSKIKLKTLTKQQLKEIDDYYYSMTGMKVNHHWHQYFYSRNNVFSEKYIPVDFYNNELIYRLNNFGMRHAYSDKNIYSTIFKEFNQPRTVLKKINGYYYIDEMAISNNEAKDIYWNLNKSIIKPSLEGTWGEGVKMISANNGISNIEGKNIEEILKEYDNNFIIQEYIHQHSDISILNPSSVNTIRVITYRNENNDINVVYHVLRIGETGSMVDNVGFGGINVKILPDGTLNEFGFGYSADKFYKKASSGIELKDYKVPMFSELLETAKKMHLKLPYFKLIGWDFGIDSDENPILIEWNRCPDLSQTAHGPAFGDLTDEIFKRLKKLPDTRFVVYNE